MTTRTTMIVVLAGLATGCGRAPSAPAAVAPAVAAPAVAAHAEPHLVDGPAPTAIVIFVQSNGGESQYVGVPGKAAVAYVQVQNNGPAPVDVDVLCVVKAQRDGVEVDRTLARWTTRATGLAPGELRLVYLTAPVAETRTLPVAVALPTSCGTRLAGRDGSYVHTRTDWPVFSPHVAPDLRWRRDGPALDAYDCATAAVPVAGREVCIEAFLGPIEGMNSAAAQARRFAVACRLDGQTRRVVTTLADRADPIRFRFAALPPGRHALRCTLDDDRRLTESSERNNAAETLVTTLRGSGEWHYGVAIRRVAPTATWLRGGHDTPTPPAYALAVVVTNTGAHGLRDLAIDCTAPGVHFAGGGVASLPEHLLGPGDITLHLRSLDPRPPPGRVTLTCTLHLTRPALAPPATFIATVDLPP